MGTDSDWATASAGLEGGWAVKTDGSLWSIDAAPTGDLGYSMQLTITRVGSDSDWSAVSAGSFSSLALKSDGSLWSLGYDFSGLTVVDDESATTTTTTATTTETPATSLIKATQIGSDKSWTAISCGFLGASALKSDGSLWSLGYSIQIGLDSLDTSLLDIGFKPPERVGTDNDWTAVSHGGEHVLAIKEDGSLWAMGDNTYGQLGDGTTDSRDDFTQIGLGTDWAAVSAGLGHSLALKTDGSLWVWGDNEFGQLGDGKTDGRKEPEKLLTGIKPVAVTAAPEPFSDISTSPYAKAIKSLAKLGIISGFSDGTFRPDQPVNRQQFAKMIVLGLGLPVSEGAVPLTFPDVDNPADNLYPDDYVAVASANKLIQGYPDGKFNPLFNVTRAQVLTIVVRAAQNLKPAAVQTPPAGRKGSLPTDNPTHGTNIGIAEYSGFTAGIDPAGFDVYGPATRGEIAQIIYNLRNK